MADRAARTTTIDPGHLEALAAERFPELTLDCGRRGDPGLVDSTQWRDWTVRETTPDQLRIEDYLDMQDLRGRSILHIGLGNSGLALHFHERAREIVGTTVVPAERDNGRALGLANYHVALHNKYTGAAEGMADHFDFVVDNNPTTFCCCLAHLATMLEFYADKLGESGQFVTDRVGLGWTHVPGCNPRWSFGFDDLAAVGALAGLKATQVDRDVWVLSRKPPAPLPASARAKLLVRRAARRIARAWAVRRNRLPFVRRALT